MQAPSGVHRVPYPRWLGTLCPRRDRSRRCATAVPGDALRAVAADQDARRTFRGDGEMSVIVARALTQRFATGVLALDSLDLEVGSGDRLAVLGPNGAGKTTLLRILATA